MKGLARFALFIALGGGVITFVIAFFLLRSANWSSVTALLISLILFVLATVGIWLLTDSRSTRQVEIDAYTLQARQEASEVLRQVQQVQLQLSRIQNYQTRTMLHEMCKDVEELLHRIQRYTPSDMLSSATTLSGYISRMQPLVEKYSDIEGSPRYYENPSQKLQEIQQGFQSFDGYLVDSIKLINHGQNLVLDVDLHMLEAAQYRRLA